MEVHQRCKIWLVFEKILTLIRHPAGKGTIYLQDSFSGTSLSWIPRFMTLNIHEKSFQNLKVVFGAELRNVEVISKILSVSEI